MVIAVVVAVVLAAVIGGYFALRPSGGRKQASELRTLRDERPESHRLAPPERPATRPEPVVPVEPVEPAPPMSAPRFVAAEPVEAEPTEAGPTENDRDPEYEYVEVIEYVEVEGDEEDGEDREVERGQGEADAPDELVDEGASIEAIAFEEADGPADEPDLELRAFDDLDPSPTVADEPPQVEVADAVASVEVDQPEPDEAADPSASAADELEPEPYRTAASVPDEEAVSVEGAVSVDEPDQPGPAAASDDETDARAASELAEVIELDEGVDDGGSEESLAEVVAELIDEADPEVADVMARLIDASDPDLVARLVDEPDLEVAEVVARLVDAADPAVAAMVTELADAPDRRDVAEVLRLVDTAYGMGDARGEIPPEVAAKLEELDIEADLELTSRPGEMSGFAQLSDQDKLRVIIRVLCGLVGRDDLPPPRRGPRNPASVAEQRMWPLSRARWPVPPPTAVARTKADDELTLPARRQSSRAS